MAKLNGLGQMNKLVKFSRLNRPDGRSGLDRMGGLDSLWWVFNYNLATSTQHFLAVLVL